MGCVREDINMSGLRIFQGRREMAEAMDHAAAGGRALWVIPAKALVPPHAPQCFREAARRGEDMGKLFDQNARRLRTLALELGVKRVVIDRPGLRGQHVDLVGGPLRKAKALAGLTAMEEARQVLKDMGELEAAPVPRQQGGV